MACPKTPGCTDYSPNHDNKLKKLSKYAPLNEKRWKEKELFNKPVPLNKVHSYGVDQSNKPFSSSNSGTMGRAKRWDGDRPMSSGASSASRSRNSISPNRTMLITNNLRLTKQSELDPHSFSNDNLSENLQGPPSRPGTEVGKRRLRK